MEEREEGGKRKDGRDGEGERERERERERGKEKHNTFSLVA